MSRGVAPLLILWGALALAADPGPAVPSPDEAKQGALRFGQALTSADMALLRPLLPVRGKVRLRLIHVAGPEEGSYSPGQVESLLGGFLGKNRIDSFEIVRDEGSRDGFAIVHALVHVRCPDGKASRVHLHLTFEPEEGRWILREIRETPP